MNTKDNKEPGFKSHVFICTNSPASKDKPKRCGWEGSAELQKNLKAKCAEAFGKDVRVSSSGCLGYCDRGIAAVVYPKTKWLLDLKKDDTERVFQAVKESL